MTDTVLFYGFAAAYLALLVWGCALAVSRGRLRPADVSLLVLVALIYDNLVLASGRSIGEGALLESLNVARYWLHAFFTPLLVVFAWQATARAGVGWARSRGAASALPS